MLIRSEIITKEAGQTHQFLWKPVMTSFYRKNLDSKFSPIASVIATTIFDWCVYLASKRKDRILLKSFWKKYREYCKYCEYAVALILLLIPLLGVTIHYLLSHSCCFEACNASTYQAVLQMQATVVTLSLTLLTLIVNYSGSVYGVPIIDYFISKKPSLLTQKRIIVILLALLLFAVSLNYFGYWQCLAFYTFSDSIMLIIYSVSIIYPVFNGSYSAKNEIGAWLSERIKTSSLSEQELMKIFEAFMEDWQKQEKQNSLEYKDYEDLYTIMIERLADYENNDGDDDDASTRQTTE